MAWVPWWSLGVRVGAAGLDGIVFAADADGMDTDGRLPDPFTLGAFGLSVLFGAGNFLAVRLSNLGLPPFWGAGLRFGTAAVTFVALALLLRLRWPQGRLLGLTVLYGVLGFGLFYALMYWSLTRVTASVAVIVMAVVPLATLLLASAQGTERLQARNTLGAFLALAGIAWLAFGPQAVVVPLVALATMLAAAAAVSQSIIVSKRISGNHPIVTNAIALGVGAMVLLAISSVAGEAWALPSEPEAVWAVLYLVTFGSLGLFVLVLLVVRRWTASATSYMFVLFPVVTMLLEAWILDEPITAQALTGAALVMIGVWFGALSPGARRSMGRSSAAGPPTPTAAETP